MDKKREIKWIELEIEQLKVCSQYVLKKEDYNRLLKYIKKKERILEEMKNE